ncbi:hypothetical protein PQ455_13420 [Sphingomonas naphthae]|uniref:Uncharacterized protein n=1 Tax=Sphingomonas naphthae TaxID=1813468 RepID=A0ABY7TIS0_9SPHN|nr:hypothetical protein [Sphingomonas naphthae]WCT72627.1 hypothetical protein PQ455_13420 [Sphingomonas naphthae]
MTKTTDIAPEPFAIRERVLELRERFGDCDWLRVVGGVTAEAYRLAGFTTEEFASLLRTEIEKRGRLPIDFRRKDIMRLRAGFDGATGFMTEQHGLANLYLNFQGGHYSDANDDPNLEFTGALRSSLAIVGGLRRPIAALALQQAPRCLLSGGGRMEGRFETVLRPWGYTKTTKISPARRIETLGLMPNEVAKLLDIKRQRSLSHIPWLDDYQAPPAFGSSEPFAKPVTSPAKRKWPALRLVRS